MDGGVGGDNGRPKAIGRDERVCAFKGEREKALKAGRLTYSILDATALVMLPITAHQ